METTIRLNQTTKTELDNFKQYKSESYDELVRKLIYLAKLTEKKPKLSQKTILEKKAIDFLNKLEKEIKERIWNKLQQCKEEPFRFLEHLEEIDGYKLRLEIIV